MKALVTGGAGFVGSHVVDKLLDNECDVLVVDNLTSGDTSNVNPAAKLEVLDILDADSLMRLFQKFQPDVVLHLAAQVSVSISVRDPIFDASVNILGSLNVLDATSRVGASLVYASSAACYGPPAELPITETHVCAPASPYGISKLSAEHYLSAFRQTHGLVGTTLRLSNVYGPRQSPASEAGVVATFAYRLCSGARVNISGEGKQTRDFIYVGDVAEAFCHAIRAPSGTYNIGTGRESSVMDVWSMMAQCARQRGKDVADPLMVDSRAGDIARSVFDCTKAAKHLGWVAHTTLETGIRMTFEHASACCESQWGRC